MRSFDAYRERFIALYEAVKRTHEVSHNQHHGHGLDHDVAVAQMAALIAPTSRLSDTGWVAGLMHSTDRLVATDAYTTHLRAYLDLLPAPEFSNEEIEEIYIAVLEHDQKVPLHRSPTQEVLQDADKLVNMQATMLIRAGQFHADIPTVELSHLEKMNPASTYHAPKNVLDNTRIIAAEYPGLLHTPKAKELASVYMKRLREHEQHILEDHRLLGLVGVEL